MLHVEEKIDFYHRVYGQILDKVSMNWPENAIDISGSIFQEISKDLRSEMIAQLRRENRVNRGKNSNDRIPETENNLATKKQRQTIHKFGVKKIPEDLSKDEASDILEELIDLSKHGNNEILKDRVDDLNEQWTNSV